MRAFIIAGPGLGEVRDVEPPRAHGGEVVVDVARVGLCGTDVELFSGQMAYLQSGEAAYPLRIGHEWCGTVSSVGPGVDESWLGRRVTGDTMLGCGRCDRCEGGRQHLCADRFEVGIRGGFPGALAEQLAVPATSLRAIPDAIDDTTGAMVEPGGNAWRALEAADVTAGERLLILGTGALGLLIGLMARAHGLEVHLRRAPRGFDRVRAVARLRRRLVGLDPPRRLVRRRRRCLQRRRAAGPRRGPRGTWPARRLDRPLGRPEPRRQPAGGAQGRDGRRDPERARQASAGRSSCSPRAASIRRRWSPRSSASRRSRACSAARATAHGAHAPKIQVDPRR